MKRALLSSVFIVCAGLASAQPQMSDSGKPIAVNADKFVADLKGETGTYTGNVVVTQGRVKLHADTITVAAPGGKATRMEAAGHVVVDSPSGTAIGDKGTYDVTADTVRITGNVVLTKDKNVMRGSALDVHMETGQAKLVGVAQTSGPSRVQGKFLPKTRGSQ